MKEKIGATLETMLKDIKSEDLKGKRQLLVHNEYLENRNISVQEYMIFFLDIGFGIELCNNKTIIITW